LLAAAARAALAAPAPQFDTVYLRALTQGKDTVLLHKVTVANRCLPLLSVYTLDRSSVLLHKVTCPKYVTHPCAADSECSGKGIFD